MVKMMMLKVKVKVLEEDTSKGKTDSATHLEQLVMKWKQMRVIQMTLTLMLGQ